MGMQARANVRYGSLRIFLFDVALMCVVHLTYEAADAEEPYTLCVTKLFGQNIDTAFIGSANCVAPRRHNRDKPFVHLKGMLLVRVGAPKLEHCHAMAARQQAQSRVLLRLTVAVLFSL